jgi:hypothetical protein
MFSTKNKSKDFNEEGPELRTADKENIGTDFMRQQL